MTRLVRFMLYFIYLSSQRDTRLDFVQDTKFNGHLWDAVVVYSKKESDHPF